MNDINQWKSVKKLYKRVNKKKHRSLSNVIVRENKLKKSSWLKRFLKKYFSLNNILNRLFV